MTKFHLRKESFGYGEIYLKYTNEFGNTEYLSDLFDEDKIYDMEIKGGKIVIVGVEQS